MDQLRRAADGLARVADGLLGRCAVLVPPGRRGWAQALRAEAGEVPAGAARLGWVAGGLWLVAREAQMVRRLGYGLAVVAVAVAAAAVMRYVWHGAPGDLAAGWDKARVVLAVVLLAGLPWVARRRSVFGPAGRSITVRLVRAGGAAAVLVLVLDIARMEHYPGQSMNGRNGIPEPWAWAWEALGVGLIAACLAAVLIVTAWWPQVSRVLVGWCAAVAGVALFVTVAPVQVLITVYVAGILAVTARRSPVTPATLAISAAAGAAGGAALAVLWGLLRYAHPGSRSGIDRAVLLLLVLAAVAAAGTTAAGMVAARRASGPGDPLALRRARYWQCLAAGPLTAATAAVMIPLLRASTAVRVAAACPAAHAGQCTVAPHVWMFLLVAGPALGLGIGWFAGSITAVQPGEPPLALPREPRPGGSKSCGVFVSNS